MSQWHVQRGSKTEVITESTLRRRLKKSDYSGVELVRRDGTSIWKPLHDVPLFTELVPHTGDAKLVAQKRQLVSFGWHALGYATCLYFFGFGVLMAIWGLFLLGHLARSVPALHGLIERVRAT